jgi:uncharacterized membrane protein HdeD (DUF308 family)
MNESQQSFGGKARLYFMLFMSGIYIVLGIGFLTTLKIESLSDTNRKMIGAVLLVYGLFRIYTLMRRRR